MIHVVFFPMAKINGGTRLSKLHLFLESRHCLRNRIRASLELVMVTLIDETGTYRDDYAISQRHGRNSCRGDASHAEANMTQDVTIRLPVGLEVTEKRPCPKCSCQRFETVYTM